MSQQSAFPLSDSRSLEALSSVESIRSAVRSSKTTPGVPLSDTCLRWIASLYDPRGTYEAAWVPSMTQYSQKSKCFARGSFATGTTGYGAIWSNANSTSDGIIAQVTQPGSVMTPNTLLSAVTAPQNIVGTNSQFNSASIANTAGGVQSRIVGYSLYVRYAGTELNRGGDYVLMEEPNHNNATGYSYTTALSLDGVKRVPITDDWVHVAYAPNNMTEVAFTANNSGLPWGITTYPFAVFVNSAAVAGQPFEYEIYGWYEYSGPPARSATVSYDDPVGFGIIMGAANMYQQLDSALGIDGFMRAIEAQMRAQSGVLVRGAPAGNWAGLLPFIPALLSLVGPSVIDAGRALVNRFIGPVPKQTQSEKEVKTAVKELKKIGKPPKEKKKK